MPIRCHVPSRKARRRSRPEASSSHEVSGDSSIRSTRRNLWRATVRGVPVSRQRNCVVIVVLLSLQNGKRPRLEDRGRVGPLLAGPDQGVTLLRLDQAGEDRLGEAGIVQLDREVGLPSLLVADHAAPISAAPPYTRKSGAFSLVLSIGEIVTLDLTVRVVSEPTKEPSCLVKVPMVAMLVLLCLSDRLIAARQRTVKTGSLGGRRARRGGVSPGLAGSSCSRKAGTPRRGRSPCPGDAEVRFRFRAWRAVIVIRRSDRGETTRRRSRNDKRDGE